MKVGENNSAVSKYLKTLIDFGIAKKETPITEKPGKKTIYLLADNFFRFWYRFVPVNMSAIDYGRITKTYPYAVKQYLSDYMGLIFEKIGLDELELIRDYAFVFGKGNNYHYYIFSKGGFTDGLLQAQEQFN